MDDEKLRRTYWVSWYEPVDDRRDPRPLSWPLPNSITYWISGWRGDMSAATICAAIDADSQEEAESLVRRYWQPESWRFCNEHAYGWRPPADRFPPPAERRRG